MAHSGFCHSPSACIWRGVPQGQRSGWAGGKPRVLSDGLDLVFLTHLLLRKPRPRHIVRTRQREGRGASGLLEGWLS